MIFAREVIIPAELRRQQREKQTREWDAHLLSSPELKQCTALNHSNVQQDNEWLPMIGCHMPIRGSCYHGGSCLGTLGAGGWSISG